MDLFINRQKQLLTVFTIDYSLLTFYWLYQFQARRARTEQLLWDMDCLSLSGHLQAQRGTKGVAHKVEGVTGRHATNLDRSGLAHHGV